MDNGPKSDPSVQSDQSRNGRPLWKSDPHTLASVRHGALAAALARTLIAAVIALGAAQIASAGAQDNPPAPAPPLVPAPSQAPPPQEPAPDRAADQKAKEPTQPDAAEEPAPASHEDLSIRYRFLEKYGLAEDTAHPEALWKYKVGIQETIKTVVEQAQGAPIRREDSQQIIYTERPAKIGRRGEVTEAIRRYDRYRMKGNSSTRPLVPPLFEGLTVWYQQRRAGQAPLLLSLTENRPLREQEYTGIMRHAFLPQLAALMPPTPRRVLETWQVPRATAQSLIGVPTDVEDYELKGSLDKLVPSTNKTQSGAANVAVVRLSGGMTLPEGACSINAEIQFAFDLPSAAAPAPAPNVEDTTKTAKPEPRPAAAKRGEAGVVDARRRIWRIAQRKPSPRRPPEPAAASSKR